MKRRMNRRALPEDSVRDTVNAIIQDVSARGDEALFDYASRFDKAHLDSSSLFVTEAELAEAEAMVEGSVKEAIAVSLANIHYFFRPQPQAGLVRRKCAGRGGGGAVPSVRPCGHLYSRRESAPGIHFHHDGRFCSGRRRAGDCGRYALRAGRPGESRTFVCAESLRRDGNCQDRGRSGDSRPCTGDGERETGGKRFLVPATVLWWRPNASWWGLLPLICCPDPVK